jgi:hypothetical protein
VVQPQTLEIQPGHAAELFISINTGAIGNLAFMVYF